MATEIYRIQALSIRSWLCVADLMLLHRIGWPLYKLSMGIILKCARTSRWHSAKRLVDRFYWCWTTQNTKTVYMAPNWWWLIRRNVFGTMSVSRRCCQDGRGGLQVLTNSQKGEDHLPVWPYLVDTCVYRRYICLLFNLLMFQIIGFCMLYCCCCCCCCNSRQTVGWLNWWKIVRNVLAVRMIVPGLENVFVPTLLSCCCCCCCLSF